MSHVVTFEATLVSAIPTAHSSTFVTTYWEPIVSANLIADSSAEFSSLLVANLTTFIISHEATVIATIKKAH